MLFAGFFCGLNLNYQANYFILCIFRLQVITEASTNLAHRDRKRKCEGEQLEPPTPKHMCFARVSISEAAEPLENNSPASSFQTHLISYKTESMSHSDLNSVEDSNSLPAHSASTTSSICRTKSDPECSNAYAYSYMMGEYDTSDSAADGYPNLEDHPLDPEMHGSYAKYECGDDAMELGQDKDLEDLLYSNCSEVNPNMFVLSSGRWVINQDAQSVTRKPTIDQEFEQYFSALML
uniref:Uncharacterized protein n=1 Tax=Kalanchoe fedtschenkoi TaxID=63787 RepID=A0A7N0RHP0_KALFE